MADSDDSRTPTDDLGSLQFGPAWARKPGGEAVYTEPSGREDRRRSGGGRGPRGNGRPASAERPMPRRSAAPDDRPAHGPAFRDAAPRPPRFDPNLPVIVSFLPERDHLGGLVKKIRQSCRAYPLRDLAQMFVDRSALLLVKYETLRQPPPAPAPAPAPVAPAEAPASDAPEADMGDAPAPAVETAPEPDPVPAPAPAPAPSHPETMLYQCRMCGYAGFDREEVARHVCQDHMGDIFDTEEIETDPPEVAAVSVLKCGYSGEWIGPPQLHTTTQRILELHRERFGHMPLDAYKAKLQTLREPEAIEEWKQASRKQTRYRLKDTADAPALTRREAEDHVRTHLLASSIRSGARAIVPAVVAEKLGDPILRQAFLQARGKETQYPRTLMDALRPAFRHMRMKLFKHGEHATYVTATPPAPLDPAQAAEPVRKILEVLKAKPEAHRKDLCLGLGLDLADAEACQEVLTHLRWLVEKGHVIELFSGALILPG